MSNHPNHHTPGPWRWVLEETGLYLMGMESSEAESSLPIPIIDNTCGEYRTLVTSADTPDADLLRAAPDMLAALKEVAAATYPTRDGLVGGSVLRPRSSHREGRRGSVMPVGKKERKRLYDLALDRWGLDRQMSMLAEECAELIVAVQHFRRRRVQANLLEEMADVSIMIEQICHALECEDQVVSCVQTKIRWLRRRLRKGQAS
jgi:NTP pyrophosphatase (non-canonical NTP hydrolase)